jgi:hypothetical protein
MLAVTDLNGDGVLDILAPAEPSMQNDSQAAPPTTATWIALDGSSGKELWNRPGTPCRDESNCFEEAAQVCAIPRIGQDMVPASQIYFVDVRDQPSTKGGAVERKLIIAAVAAKSGVELWNTSLDVNSGFRRNLSFFGDRLYSQAMKTLEGKSMLLVAYEHERKDYVHLFDHQGTTVSKKTFQQATTYPKPPIVWDSFDGDGDGILDRALVGSPVAMVDLHRGLETLFELSNSSLASTSTSAEDATRTTEPMAIEVLVRGESVSPQIILHARGEYPQVTGFDALDGKRLWSSYGPTRHKTYSSEIASSILIHRPDGSAPIVVYNHIDQANARFASLEKGPSKKLEPPALSGEYGADIRFRRSLPWLQNSMMTESPMEVLAFLATGLLQSVLLVWIPGGYFYATIRKGEWSLRSLLMLPVVVALVLIVLQLQQVDSGSTWIASFGLAFLFAPLSGLLGTLALRCVQLRWREALNIFSIILIGALCTASIVLVVRGGTEPLDRGEYYDWSGWYWILPQSLFITAYLYMGWRMVQWLVPKKMVASKS